jgi:diguanylate cyclase (GGDEF)-like protein
MGFHGRYPRYFFAELQAHYILYVVHIKKFQNKILLGFLVLLAAVQALVFVFVRQATTDAAMDGIKRSLNSAHTLFERSMESRSQSLMIAASMLSSDHAFKQAYATQDPETIRSALDNLRERIGAETIFITNLEGEFIASSGAGIKIDQNSLQQVNQSKENAFTIAISEKIMSIVRVPLRAPLPIAQIYVGFAIDQLMAEQLKKSAQVEVTFLRRLQEGAWEPVASTGKAKWEQSHVQAMDEADAKPISFAMGEDLLLTIASKKSLPDGGKLQIALQMSLTEAMKPTKKLFNILLFVFTLSALLSVAMAFLLSRSIAKPIRQLEAAAITVAKGNLETKIEVSSQDEIGQLAESFNFMTGALEEESRQKKIAYDGLNRKLLEQSALFEISRATAFVSDPLLIVSAVIDKISDLFPVKAVTAYIQRENQSGLTPSLRRENNSDGTFRILTQTDFAVEGTFKEVEQIGTNLSQLTLREEEVTGSMRMNFFGRSDLLLNLGMKKKRLGVIAIEERVQGSIAPKDLQFLETIAAQTSTIIENSQLYKDSMMDTLTGIYNKRYFEASMSMEVHRSLRDNRPFTLVLADVDFFKKVNDTYGHPVGDLVLRNFANLLRQKIRKSDLVCRVGGEEFAMILPNTTGNTAATVVENLRLAIAESEVQTDRGPLKVTASFGISSFPASAKDPSLLYKFADDALYRAKTNGRNRVEQYDNTIVM